MPVHDEQNANLSKTQKDILYGALLGDGCLTVHKNGINAQFCYLSKSSQHTNYIGSFFDDFISSTGIKNGSYFDKRTNKTYNNTYFKTIANMEFTIEYNRWYQNGKKQIPNDLILNPTICLIWYIGDGGICHLKRTECIKLSTQCFSKEEQEKTLLPQLSEFEAKLMKADVGSDGIQQYFIYIPRRKIKKFLEYIGDCPFSDYEYKWNVTNYKYKQPKNHTAYEKEFCEMYKSGMTYYAIAKKFNIEPNAVKYYLKKNGLYKNKEKEL